MNLLDYHIHTHHSCDSRTSMQEACLAAISRNIGEIGFCDHYDLIPADPCFNYFQPESFWEDITSCRHEFGENLVIRAGIEIGEPHLFPRDVAHMLNSFPWDYALGSLHWVGEEIVFDSPYFQRSEDEAYRTYFLALQELVSEGNFDILAHMDVVKRRGFSYYGNYDPLRYEKEIRSVLKTIAARGLALEINTSALHRGVHDFTPSPIMVAWFLEEGGRWITLGSDAHRLPQIGRGIRAAAQMAITAGFEGLASFHRRTPSLLT